MTMFDTRFRIAYVNNRGIVSYGSFFAASAQEAMSVVIFYKVMRHRNLVHWIEESGKNQVEYAQNARHALTCLSALFTLDPMAFDLLEASFA